MPEVCQAKMSCKSHATEGSQILRKSKKQSTLKVW